MKMVRREVVAVRIYPSGGMVCQHVSLRELMNVRFAIRELRDGKPACISIYYLHIFRCVWATIREVSP